MSNYTLYACECCNKLFVNAARPFIKAPPRGWIGETPFFWEPCAECKRERDEYYRKMNEEMKAVESLTK